MDRESNGIRDAILEVIEVSLDAQLRAVRRLRRGQPPPPPARRRLRKGMSQLDMAYDILHRAGGPLHVTEILRRIEKTHGRTVDRESLVSALAKRVTRGDRFERAGKNTFALRKEAT